MDIAAGIIAALGTAIAAVIGAVAFLKKSAVPGSRAVSLPRSLWDWVEIKNYVDQVPARIRTNVETMLNDDGEAPK